MYACAALSVVAIGLVKFPSLAKPEYAFICICLKNMLFGYTFKIVSLLHDLQLFDQCNLSQYPY